MPTAMPHVLDARDRPVPPGDIRPAGRPSDLPGWDDLARHAAFYSGADWLGFVDRMSAIDSHYLGLYRQGRLVAAVSTHVERDRPGPPDPILGGYRGNRSSVLLDPALPATARIEALAQAMAAALAAHPGALSWRWPDLNTADAKTVVQAARRLPGARARIALQTVESAIAVTGRDPESQAATLPSKGRRSQFRRERAKFDAAGLRIARVALTEYARPFGAMLANVQRKYGHAATDADKAAILALQARLLGRHGVTFACFHGDRAIGFSQFYRWGPVLYLRVVGFDYDALRAAGEYAMLAFHAPLDLAQAEGLASLHLGLESHEAKARRGARLTPLWTVSVAPEPEPEPDPETDPGRWPARLRDMLGPMPERDVAPVAQAVAAMAAWAAET